MAYKKAFLPVNRQEGISKPLVAPLLASQDQFKGTYAVTWIVTD